LQGLNPLVGPSFPLGPRFPSLSDAYDPILRLAFFRAAKVLAIEDLCQSGTYAFVTGPTYESRAESRYLRQIGADAVGMSTVPEVIAAHQCGLRVLAISLITNAVVVKDYFDAKKAAGQNMSLAQAVHYLREDRAEAANHEEVLEVGRLRADEIRMLVEHVICNTHL
jgi:purine-nucleoside phosphorylase